MKPKWIDSELHNETVAVVTMMRPDQRNALNIAMIDELCLSIEHLQQSSCRVIIFAGSGPVFSAGLDLKEAADPELVETTAAHVAKLLTTIYNTSLVTIAAVQGDALAGGAGLVAACDLVVMAKNAHIGFPEIRRGLVAALVSTILMRQLSGRHVRELLLTGEAVDAMRALSMGLVNRVVGNNDVLSEAIKMAQNVLKGSPESLKRTKRLLSDITPGDFSKDVQHALALHHSVRQSDEAKEGITAFLEKRLPAWDVPDRAG